ncbi:DUF523 domain-containing protein [Roseibium algae]|uniref:DUF523 domain-containing protein n=1 Tax=Roseibium algae TaxID=3123038 RepID=A0ABU8TLW3_9HYPH
MKSKILVSGCLLGRPVRYNGSSLTLESDLLTEWSRLGMIVPLCPEVAAGFQIPRPPAEIEPGCDGSDVSSGRGKIFEDNGSDVTDLFQAGAQIAVETAIAEGCGYALLTDGSPSCGSTFIYSGHHDGARKSGFGIVTSRLREAGIKVFAQHQIQQLADELSS